MSAASSGSADQALSAAELAVLRQLDVGQRWQLLDDVADAAGLTRSATSAAVRRLYYLFGYAVPESPHTQRLTLARWSCSTLGEARLRREPAGLF